MQIIFFSDAHLSEHDIDHSRLVCRFVDDVCADADMVCVLGDIFEFYHGYDGYVFPWYRDVVEALRKIASGVRPVFFIEGNHEFGMGSFFETYTGIRVVRSLTLDVDGKKTLVAHGDEFGGPHMRNLLKSKFVFSVMDTLGPALTWKVAMFCRLFLSKRNKAYQEAVRDRYRYFAEQKLSEGYDAVVLAHSHIPDLEHWQEGDRTLTYLNTGDLCEYMSYGEYTSAGGFALRIYEAGG